MMNIENFKKDATAVMNVIGRYNLDRSGGYAGCYEDLNLNDRMEFEVDGAGCLLLRNAEFNISQALLAIVIFNDVAVRWYYKSRNRGTGANISTKIRKISEWMELMDKFQQDHPECTIQNWKQFMDDNWPQDFTGLHDDEEDDELD